MSNHTIFIVLSYTAGFLILGWTAFSPWLKKRAVLTRLKQFQQESD